MTVIVAQHDGDDGDGQDDAVAEAMEAVIDEGEAHHTEQRRMWCLQQAMSVALTALRWAPQAPMVDITHAAEEMCASIETGVVRTNTVSRAKQ